MKPASEKLFELIEVEAEGVMMKPTVARSDPTEEAPATSRGRGLPVPNLHTNTRQGVAYIPEGPFP